MAYSSTISLREQQSDLRPSYGRFRDQVRPGDRVVYVRQLRSTIGEKPKVRGAIRALGLHRIGHVALQPPVGSTWGNLRRARHLTRFALAGFSQNQDIDDLHWLEWGTHEAWKLLGITGDAVDAMVFSIADLDSAPSTEVDRPVPSEDAGSRVREEVGVGVSVNSFELELGSGAHLDTPEGDSIWIVRYEHGGSSLTWPTELSSAEFFMKALARIKVRNGVRHLVEVYVSDDSDPEYLSVADLAEPDYPANHSPAIVRLEDEESGTAFGWQQLALGGMSSEGGLVAPKTLPRKLLADLLLQTASGTVSAYSASLADAAVEFSSSAE